MKSILSTLSPTHLHLYFPRKNAPMAVSSSNLHSSQIASMAISQRSPKTPTKTLPSTSTITAMTTSPSTPLKKVLVPIGFGTEEMEAVIIIDVLRRAGAHVIVASVEPQLEIEASSGTRLVADTLIATCSDEIFDLIALPGGMPGSARLRDCEILRKITSKQADEKRLYGAICAAPAVTLQAWGLLGRKQTTCHPAFMDKLPHFWAVKSNIQVSGELTTSRGPGTAYQFALSLVEQLFGELVAKEVGQLLLMHIVGDLPIQQEFNKADWSVDHIPRVLIPVANGCEGIEVIAIADILHRAKVDVVIASVERSVKLVAAQSTKIVSDMLISNAAESIYDLIILPGGVLSAERLQKSRILKKLLKEQESCGRIYGASGTSPAILQKHGLLENKRVTAHPSVLSKFAGEEAVDNARVVIDGKLITGTGLATVANFALAIVKKLFGHGRARSVAEGLVIEYPKT